jgi:Ran GTPase-activating protein (RanGAP) involved in mRNA processing and transport
MIVMHLNPELQHMTTPSIAAAARDAIINKQCTHLTLFDCQLLPEYVSLIASAMPGSSVLQSLELPKYYLYDLGVQYLAESLFMHNTLECLDLYDNFITNAGVEYLVEMLRLNQSLSRLKLAHNKLVNKE